MKKTIIILGLALVAFTNVAQANCTTPDTTSTTIVINDVTPLCNAIMKGDLASVKKFVEYGSNVNEKSNGLTPLMIAARYNKVEILKFLLQKGADKDLKDENGYTALKYAEISKALKAYDYLIKA